MRRVATFACVLVWVALLGIGSAQAERPPERLEKVSVGGVSFVLPIPAGFSTPRGIADGAWQIAQTIVPATNRLVAVYFRNEDLKAFMAPPADADTALSPFIRYFVVQTVREFEGVDISSEGFASLRKVFRDSQTTMYARNKADIQRSVDASSDKLREQSGDPTFRAGIPDATDTPVIYEDEQFIAMLMGGEYPYTIGGKAYRRLMVGAFGPLLVNGRALMISAYAQDRGSADTLWVRESVVRWHDAILRANP